MKFYNNLNLWKKVPQIFYFTIKTEVFLKRNQYFPFTPEMIDPVLKKFYKAFG